MNFLIVHLLETDRLHSDGVAVHIRGLREGLGRLGHDSRLVSFSDVSLRAQADYRERVASAYKCGGSNRGIMETFKLRRDLISETVRSLDLSAFDAIFAQGPLEYSSLPGQIRLPAVLTIHAFRTDDELRKGALASGSSEEAWFRSEEEQALRAAKLIAAVSGAYLDEAVRRGAAPQRSAVISNGIDCARYAIEVRPRKSAIRTIGFLGRLSEQKGVDILLRAFALVAEKSPEIRLIIAGDGEDREKLKKLSEDLGVDGSVEWLGEIRDVPSFLASIDLAVMPSRWEGLPYALLEIGAAGVPIVAAQVGGIAEMISPEEGTLVPPENVGALAREIESVIAGSAEAHLAAVALRTKIRDRYSLERMAQSYIEIAGRT